MYEAINNYISRCASISESEMELFNSLLKKTTVPKKPTSYKKVKFVILKLLLSKDVFAVFTLMKMGLK